MPHNEKLVPKPHAFPRLFGQRPLTKAVDYSKSVKVELVQHPDMVTALDGLYDFVKATWSEDGRESERTTYEEKIKALEQMLQGKSLQLGLETIQFIFRISGISRIDTHQIVRQRIGVTFSQQCSGDQFWTHHNVLVEPSIYWALRGGVDDRGMLYDSFINTALEAKMSYQTMIDSQDVSIQAARSILPHCLDTFVFMKVDLGTLLLFHRKRIDDGSQTWQMNSIAQQMADKVSRVFPDLHDTFEKNKATFKFQKEASKDRKNTFSTGLYLPDPDDFDYHELDFLYQKTKKDMHLHSFPEMPTEYYWGRQQITKEQYELIQLEYDRANRRAEKGNLTNAQIFEMNLRLNAELAKNLK